jgi:transposase
MVLSSTLRPQACRRCPTGLAARSMLTWCREPVRSLDPDTRRHPGVSPAARRQQSTPGRISPAGSPASPPCSRRRALEVICTPGAGLDVHQKTVMACRVTPDPTGQQPDGLMEVREFGTLTRDLLALSDGLAALGSTHVAIESTGESWKPVSNILAGECPVCLVNAAHVTQGPGRQTDTSEARELAKRRRDGWLPARFIPPQGQRARRDLTRYRTKLVQARNREVNRVQGVLERAHITLAAVATAVRGVSGRAILAALVDGQADPATRAAWAKGRRRRKRPRLEQALTGLVRDHHRQLLTRQLAPIDFLDDQIDTLSVESMRRLTALGPGAPLATPGETAGTTGSMADTDTPPMTCARAVTLLDTSAGGDQRGGERLVAAWGIDRGRVETAARGSAWRGVAPGQDESAGKRRSGKTRKGNRALRTGLTQVAHAAARTKGTYLSALSQRLAARRGKTRAIMAVAHAIVVSAFHMLSRNEPYHELGANSFDAYRREHLIDQLTRRIERLGYRVSLEPVPAV